MRPRSPDRRPWAVVAVSLAIITSAPRIAGANTVAVGSTQILVVSDDGTVHSVPLDGGLDVAASASRIEGPTGVTAVAAGVEHWLALDAHGRVWAAGGSNSFGQLGLEGLESAELPVVLPGLKDVVAIAAGDYHSVALTRWGSLYAWGRGDEYQLDNGSSEHRPTPTLVRGLSGVAAIAAGGSHTLAVLGPLDGGALKVFGRNAEGQAGDGTRSPAANPVTADALRGVVRIAGGGRFSLAVTSDGRVHSWGSNERAALARRTELGSDPTVGVIEAIRSPVALAAGGAHALAITPEHTVAAWGDGVSAPEEVPGLREVVAVGAGGSSDGSQPGVNVAVTARGEVFAWRSGRRPRRLAGAGFVWIPVEGPRLTPETKATGGSVPGDLRGGPQTELVVATPVLSLASGTYAAGTTVTLTCSTSGAEIHYTLNGVDPTVNDPFVTTGQTLVVGIYTLKAKAFRTGDTSSSTVSATYSITGTFAAPQVAGGNAHSLLLRHDGTVWASGLASSGQIGDGSASGMRAQPVIVAGLTGVVAIAAGSLHSLALDDQNRLWAWGGNTSGQIGDNSTTMRTRPVRVSSFPGTVASIAAGSNHSLAVTTAGDVWVWGQGTYGQLGLSSGTPTQQKVPVQVTALSSVSKVAGGSRHTLAMTTGGALYVFGTNASGQLGLGSSPTQQNTPVELTALTGVTALAAGWDHSLVAATGGTYAFGQNTVGQLGDNSTTQRTTPVLVSGLTGASILAAGERNSYAMKADGTCYGWGDNASGQTGDGTTSERHVPTPISTLSSVTWIAAGKDHALAADSSVRVWAWGENASKPIGDGTARNRWAPVKVTEASFQWKAGTPTYNPYPTGSQQSNVSVVLDTVSSTGSTIYYTLDGSTPTTGSPWVSPGGSASVTLSLTLKAYAVKAGLADSNLEEAAYTLTVPTPTFTPGQGTYTDTRQVVVACALSPVMIHYTTNGLEPTESDPEVASGGSVTVDANLTLKAKAWKTGWTPSATKSAVYTMNVASPAYSPLPGSYPGVQNVAISTVTTGATIRYTTNGLEPTTSDTVITSGSSISVDRSMTVKARAWKTGWNTSSTSVGTFTISLGTVAAPTATPAPGAFTPPLSVMLSTTTPGATIRYTLDGSTPSLFSPAYTGQILLNDTTTIRAQAFKMDWTPSSVTTALYSAPTPGVATPTMTPGSGMLGAARNVTVSCATAGATIHYTTSGADPTTADPTVTSGSSVLVNRTLRFKAKAWKTGLSPSAVATADYRLIGGIGAGAYHTLVLKDDGTVWSFGNNAYGGLGDGTTLAKNSPVQVVGLANAIAVAAGEYHSLALRSDGTVVAWGRGNVGQLGNGSTSGSLTPVVVQETGGATLGNVVAIAAGGSHSHALLAGGTVVSWGLNTNGESGSGLPGNQTRASPVANLSGVSAIFSDWDAAFGLKTDGGGAGTLYAWGNNARGALGDGTTTSSLVPQAGVTGVVTVGAGSGHTLALKADGTLLGWGLNSKGETGDGTNVSPRLTPVAGPTLASPKLLDGGVFLVQGGPTHSLALLADGTVWAWGDGSNKKLGINDTSTGPHTTPARVLWLEDAVAIAAGAAHTVALDASGRVWTGGDNGWGQLGAGGDANDDSAILKPIPGFSAADTSWLEGDPDGDGLLTQDELVLGTDPLEADTNGDGILDGPQAHSGQSATDLDMDDDGVTNTVEVQNGTDPFRGDTDEDGSSDQADCFPLDPTRWTCAPPDPSDHTPPIITLTEPTNAGLVSSVP